MAKKAQLFQKSTIAALVSDGFSELQTLAEELRDWYENLPENFKDGRGDIDDAASALERLSEPSDCPSATVGAVQVEYLPMKPKRHVSRAARRDQACYEMGLALEAAKAWVEAQDAEHGKPAEEGDDDADVDSWCDEVQEVIDEAEGVDFPGMRG